jgi:hypothetical protein
MESWYFDFALIPGLFHVVAMIEIIAGTSTAEKLFQNLGYIYPWCQSSERQDMLFETKDDCVLATHLASSPSSGTAPFCDGTMLARIYSHETLYIHRDLHLPTFTIIPSLWPALCSINAKPHHSPRCVRK